MGWLSDPEHSGTLLMVVGLLMIIGVFFLSLNEYMHVRVQLSGASNIMEALTKSSGLLIELLFKVAFLGIALAAGATLVRHAVSLLREGKRKEEKATDEDRVRSIFGRGS
ncbi:MAG: hypothetical protein J7L91_05140 [Candidatus Korarchaeota archaeon]|nr:hypothetical protein [Candidatus Korarchaeota archaeon]